MLDFTVRLVGRFDYAQETVWTAPACSVCLSISGLRYLRAPGIDMQEPGPFLWIGYAGMTSEFKYGPDRENWVLMGDSAGIRAGEIPGTVALRDGKEWIAVPALLRLRREEVPLWQQEFLRLSEAFRDPIPSHILRIRLGLAALLRPFLDHGSATSVSPAARLKQLIDSDRSCRDTIARHSRRCGFNSDHLRDLFSAAYGLSPRAYRDRCRLANAMALIAGSAQSVTEIGHSIGFDHVSHFSSFFRKAAGMTPREALRRYRHQQA